MANLYGMFPSAPITESMLLSGKRIFVVEDDAVNVAIAEYILKGQGAEVFHDYWGSFAARRLLSLLPIDVILMDLMLPRGVSGYEVFGELQEQPRLADIPAVIVSASDPTIELNKARALGFHGYICKPIDHKSFPRLIASIIDGKQVWIDEPS